MLKKAFDKIQYPFVIKISQQTSNRGKLLNLVKSIYETPTLLT